jgi:hypothetical protein
MSQLTNEREPVPGAQFSSIFTSWKDHDVWWWKEAGDYHRMDSIDDQRLEMIYNLQPLSTTKSC